MKGANNSGGHYLSFILWVLIALKNELLPKKSLFVDKVRVLQSKTI